MFGDARLLAEFAAEAEEAGWDGFFLWDHLQWPGSEPAVDPWVALAAVAMTTNQIRLGTMITPLPRRDIVKLARETASIDHLSNGRLILGVGLGWQTIPEWGGFGHQTDAKIRGEMLDEGLDVLAALWSGEPVDHQGPHYKVSTEGMSPPLQEPRIPVWVGGTWPSRKPFRRAARWDGMMPISKTAMEGGDLTPEDVAEIVAFSHQHRGDGATPMDIAKGGMTSGSDDIGEPSSFAAAGATWWLESIIPWGNSREGALARIRSGPPTVD
jgi:alkanesulfonate monooxygenase SsuD/methylene tetrahydromethanopterin reductase-like flavin-dependent oxidoreductase (luciferase family)